MNTQTILGAVVGAIIGLGIGSVFFPWCMERYGERGVIRTVIVTLIVAVVLFVWMTRPTYAGPFIELRALELIGDWRIRHEGTDISNDTFGRATLGYRVRWNEKIKFVGAATHRSSLESPNDNGQNWIEIGVDIEW